MKTLKNVITTIILLFINIYPSKILSEECYIDAGKCFSESKILMKKQGFSLRFSGTSYPCTIRGVSCGYSTTQYHFTDVENARMLIVEKVLQFIEPYNKNKRVRMYLHNFPFSFENIDISIYFFDKNNQRLLSPYICEVSSLGGKVIYEKTDPNDGKSKIFYKEKFEDALKLYNEKKSTTQISEKK